MSTDLEKRLKSGEMRIDGERSACSDDGGTGNLRFLMRECGNC